MRTIATLGPSVRLVVFQFLIKSTQVPAVIPPKRPSETPPLPPVSGVEVLESTPQVNVSPLTSKVVGGKNYELVDVWQNPHPTKWDMSFVRFVFCHKEHVNRNELFPDFVAKFAKLGVAFSSLVGNNLWAVQGHLNPYFNKDGSSTGDKVLMLGCAGRVPDTEVYSGGRDAQNRGIGPKVKMSTLASSINLKDDEVVLISPEISVPKPVERNWEEEYDEDDL